MLRTPRRRSGALLCAYLAVVAMIAMAMPAGAIERPSGTPTSLASLTIAPGQVTLSRGALSSLTVTAHLVDPDGVTPFLGSTPYVSALHCPCVVVRPLGPRPAQESGPRALSLRLTSGTPQDGIWTGRFVAGAISNGTWEVSSLAAGDLQRPVLSEDLGDSTVPVLDLMDAPPTVVVHGSDWPVLSLTLPSAPVPVGSAYVLRGTARYAQSHLPAAGLSVQIRHGGCGSLVIDTQLAGTVRTDRHGAFSLRTRIVDFDFCAFFGSSRDTQPVSGAAPASSRPFLRGTVTARASATSVRRGATVVVRGLAQPGDSTVDVQRQRGGSWLTVKQGYASATGAYALRFVPASGSGVYRVRASETRTLPATSPALRIRAS